MSAQPITYLGERHRPETAKPADVRVAATALLGLAAIALWWPTLGSWTLWALGPVAVATLTVAGVVPSWRSSIWVNIATTLSLFAWPVLVSLIVAGTLPAFGDSVRNGLQALLVESRLRTSDPAALVVWIFFMTSAFTIGSDLATRVGRGSTALAFFSLALPFGAALGLQGQGGGAAWHGGLLLVCALLWATRGNLRGTVPFVAGVALVAIVVSAAVGPKDRWEGLDQHRRSGSGSGSAAGQTPRSTNGGTALNTQQTYGPISDDFSGASMFQISSPRPALWRMQVLDEFDGRGWVTGSRQGDELPQPAAEDVRTDVKIQSLRDQRVASVGRVASVTGAGATQRRAGEAVALSSAPGSGDGYSVSAASVAPTYAQLEDLPIPTGAAYTPYTTVFQGRDDIPTPATSIVPRMAPAFAASDWGKVFRLASDLAQAPSELAVVTNVQNYLTTSGVFRYTLDAAPAGSDPLVDFLVSTHAGYCQHFAGAAALLLRLAGIPTRVATGFATGVNAGTGTYEVRDEDAHAWIEVYFRGYGWVPFNPTPAGADARIAPGVDLISPNGSGNTEQAGAHPHSGALARALAIGAIVFAALLVGMQQWRRRRGRPTPPLGDVLARLVPPPAGPTTTHLEIRAALGNIGPATAALAEEAERQRFAGGAIPPERHPWRRVWRAAIKDFGLLGAIRLMTFGPPRAPLASGPTPAPGAMRTPPLAAAPEPLAGAVASAPPPTSSVAPPGR